MKHKWTEKQYEYLASIVKGRYSDELARMMNEKFNIDLKPSQIKSAKARRKLNTGLTGQFKKGQTAWNKGKNGYMKSNKTSFKKGNMPENTVEVGTKIVDSAGYGKVKVAEPDVWEFIHRQTWEKHHGKIPGGHAVIFGDGDKSNLNIENLICVTRKQLLGLNRYNLIQKDAELTKAALNIIDLKYKICEVQNERR